MVSKEYFSALQSILEALFLTKSVKVPLQEQKRAEKSFLLNLFCTRQRSAATLNKTSILNFTSLLLKGILMSELVNSLGPLNILRSFKMQFRKLLNV